MMSSVCITKEEKLYYIFCSLVLYLTVMNIDVWQIWHIGLQARGTDNLERFFS